MDLPLASALRAARAAAGLSVRGLAARAALSFGHVSDIERGRRNASREALARLAAALPASKALRAAVEAAALLDESTIAWLAVTPGAAALLVALRDADTSDAACAAMAAEIRRGGTVR